MFFKIINNIAILWDIPTTTTAFYVYSSIIAWVHFFVVLQARLSPFSPHHAYPSLSPTLKPTPLVLAMCPLYLFIDGPYSLFSPRQIPYDPTYKWNLINNNKKKKQAKYNQRCWNKEQTDSNQKGGGREITGEQKGRVIKEHV